MTGVNAIVISRADLSKSLLDRFDGGASQLEWHSTPFNYIGVKIPTDGYEDELDRITSLDATAKIVRERIGGEQESSVENPKNLEIVPAFDVQAAKKRFDRKASGVPQLDGDKNYYSDEIDHSDIRVAVLDSGIHPGNPNVGEIEGRFNFTDEAEYDKLGHGTSVASIVRTMAPDVELYDMKVVSEDQLREAHVIQALEKCAEIGIHVVNLSLGFAPRPGKQWECPICSAVNRMFSVGVKIVASAGNHATPVEPSPPVLCPARAGGAISTGATDDDFNQKPYSANGDINHPDKWDIVD